MHFSLRSGMRVCRHGGGSIRVEKTGDGMVASGTMEVRDSDESRLPSAAHASKSRHSPHTSPSATMVKLHARAELPPHAPKVVAGAAPSSPCSARRVREICLREGLHDRRDPGLIFFINFDEQKDPGLPGVSGLSED